MSVIGFDARSDGSRRNGRHAEFFARPADDPLTIVAGEWLECFGQDPHSFEIINLRRHLSSLLGKPLQLRSDYRPVAGPTGHIMR